MNSAPIRLFWFNDPDYTRNSLLSFIGKINMTGISPQDLSDSLAGRYIAFINSIPVAIYRTTIEGSIVFCNRGFAQTLGYDSPDELISSPAINLYRNKKDRGVLVDAVMHRGRVSDLPISFIKKDGTAIWCAVTARAVPDDDGIVVHLDGVLKDITDQVEEKDEVPKLAGIVGADDIIIIFDLQGNIIDINEVGAELLGYPVRDLVEKSLSDFLIPPHRELFLLFLADILKFGSEEVIFDLTDGRGVDHQLEFNAVLIRKYGKAHHIKGIAHDITEKIKKQKDNTSRDKFQGVLEMAGGVVHRLNQPLTIINNVINDIVNDSRPDDPQYQKIMIINNQIQKMNEITEKIGKIKKYEAMDYVAGIKIVDIDKAS
ncbi:MAG: PAS domain S-box protein [Deltaproteobacteria bacterium]|nr:MAG: PAS domain S-box protein [Deltaproteobacteria bacterium]